MYIYIYTSKRKQSPPEKKKQTTSILKDPKLNYWDSRTAKSTLATEKPASLSDQGDQHLGCHKQWGEVWRSFKEKHKRYVANIWNRYWIWMPFLYILQGPCSLETNLWMIRLIWKKCTHCTFPRVTLQNIQLNTHTHSHLPPRTFPGDENRRSPPAALIFMASLGTTKAKKAWRKKTMEIFYNKRTLEGLRSSKIDIGSCKKTPI